MSAQLSPQQILAQGLAKRRGIPEEEAMALLTTLDQQENADQLTTFMARVKDSAEVLKSLDPTTRTSALQLMASTPPGGGDDMGELKKMMREVTIIRETMRGDGGGSDAVQKKIEELTKTISDMKAEEQARRIETLSTSFQTQLKTLEDKLSGQIAGINVNGDTASTGVAQFVDTLKELNATKVELLDTLGVKPDSGSGTDPVSAAETLKKLGYKVEGPRTIEDIERMMDERVKKAVDEATTRTKDQLKSDEKKMAMLVDLGSSLIDGFMPALTEGGEGAARGLSVAKNALKAVAPKLG